MASTANDWRATVCMFLVVTALGLVPASASAATCASYNTQAEAQRAADNP